MTTVNHQDVAAGAKALKKEQYLLEAEDHVRSYYTGVAESYERILHRHRYCYDRQIKLLRHLIPRPGKTLEIGCGIGQVLAGLAPEEGVGIDFCPEMIEEARRLHPKEKFPNLDFQVLSGRVCSELDTKFDTILLVNCLSELSDIVAVFKELAALTHPGTRIINLTFNYRWEPILKLGSKLGMCQKHPAQNWVSLPDFINFLELADLEMVRSGFELLFPLGIPLVSNFVNRYGSVLPGLQGIAMMHYSVIRPQPRPVSSDDVSVSIVIPCKDEEDNIDALVERIPDLGSSTEMIFVDDQSTDTTAEKVRHQIGLNPDKNIKLVEGPGLGKGAACRAGFAAATKDVLMILDADMTVMPEELPEFLEAIASGKGEFINGSRLVYPMQGEAMRFLNVLGNKVFATLISYLLTQDVKDTLCGTKAIWRKDYDGIVEAHEYFGRTDLWGDFDWLFGANRHNLKIFELPIHYVERTAGKTKMDKRFRNGMTMFRMCRIGFWRMKIL